MTQTMSRLVLPTGLGAAQLWDINAPVASGCQLWSRPVAQVGQALLGQGSHTLSGQPWCGMPGCIRRGEMHSSIRPWPADTCTWHACFRYMQHKRPAVPDFRWACNLHNANLHQAPEASNPRAAQLCRPDPQSAVLYRGTLRAAHPNAAHGWQSSPPHQHFCEEQLPAALLDEWQAQCSACGDDQVQTALS